MESLFKNILVPMDFTRKNTVALKFACTLAKQNDSSVTLLHVIETIDYVDDEEVATFYESLKDKAREKLTTAAQLFQKAKLPVQVKIMMGKRGHGIVSYAIRKKIDLIVLSSHKLNLTQASKSWATLSYQVSTLCQCPVMLVK